MLIRQAYNQLPKLLMLLSKLR